MKIINQIAELKHWLQHLQKEHKTLGFVPTMGALHQGHLELITQATKQCKVVLVSIYVNPTQFNRKDDFEKYPRTLESDLENLRNTACHAVFIPTDDEIYPSNTAHENMDFGYLETVLEGKYRAGHFKGVGMIIKRLFELIQPDKAFFGLKDFQQVLIIKQVVKKFAFKTEIVPLPTIREKTGLAMSSRNALLSENEKFLAQNLYKALLYAKENYNKLSMPEIKEQVYFNFLNEQGIKPEYFEFAEAETLKLLNSRNETKDKVVALIAAYVGKTRLIDNLEVN